MSQAGRLQEWQPRQFAVPFTVGAQAAQTGGAKETHWGVSAYLPHLQGAVAVAEPDWLYVYGVRIESSLDRRLLVARVAPDDIENFNHWRFWAGEAQGWVSDSQQALPVAGNVTNELSVEKLPGGGGRLVLVHSEAPLGPRVFVRTADRPQGPWSEPRAVFRAPEVEKNKLYFAYAAKGHSHLSRPGELLISYVVNSTDFAAGFRDASIYRPRFIRVPLDELDTN